MSERGKRCCRNSAMRGAGTGCLVKVARGKASWYFRGRERATAIQGLFAGGLAARKAGRGDLGSENASADGDRVGAVGGTCGGSSDQDYRRSFYPDHNLDIHADLACDFSLEADKTPSTANSAVPQGNMVSMCCQGLRKS